MTKYIFILLSAGLLTMGCEDVISLNSLDRAIVQAFIYAGAPVDDIRLTQPRAFGSEDSVGAPINGATVYMTHNGQRYELTETPGDTGYYHYAGDELQILEGQMYGLEFEHRGISVSSETLVPSPPQNMKLSDAGFRLSPITSRQQLMSLAQTEPILLEWDLESEAFYYLLIENMTEDPEDIIQLNQGNGPGNGGPGAGARRRRFAFISVPFEENFYEIQIQGLTQFGNYRVVVYRVNQEYVDLYETLDQDSRNLNEPLNNISNGLGVFAGFNSDTLFFEVAKL